MMGDHAIYHDGWIASTKVMRPPWDAAGAAVSQDPAGYPYELYDLTKDWTQFENVAAKYPDKLKELENLFWVEANKYQVAAARRFVRDPGSSRRVPASPPAARNSPGRARSPARRTATRRASSTRRSTSRPRSTSRRAAPKA